MAVAYHSTIHKLLLELQAKQGKMERKEVLALTNTLAPSRSAAGVAVYRAVEQGLIVCQYHLLPKGRKELTKIIRLQAQLPLGFGLARSRKKSPL